MTPQPLNAAAAESLLAFWRDAGVDACFEDAPVDRTHVQLPPPARAVAQVTARIAPQPDTADIQAQARRMAGEAQTLEALAEAAAAFQGCPLSTMGARQAVFSRGSTTAPLMVIGQGPDAEDDQRGQPFVGRTGRLLDRMLAEAGLDGRGFLTHTVFWRTPGDRAPTPDEQAVCAPFLERAFALLKPRAVLLLGASAARGVLGVEDGIMRLRGRWGEWRLAEGAVAAPAMPTFHPAFLLQTPMAKAAAWSDVLEVAARLDAEGAA